MNSLNKALTPFVFHLAHPFSSMRVGKVVTATPYPNCNLQIKATSPPPSDLDATFYGFEKQGYSIEDYLAFRKAFIKNLQNHFNPDDLNKYVLPNVSLHANPYYNLINQVTSEDEFKAHYGLYPRLDNMACLEGIYGVGSLAAIRETEVGRPVFSWDPSMRMDSGSETKVGLMAYHTFQTKDEKEKLLRRFKTYYPDPEEYLLPSSASAQEPLFVEVENLLIQFTNQAMLALRESHGVVTKTFIKHQERIAEIHRAFFRALSNKMKPHVPKELTIPAALMPNHSLLAEA